MPWLVHEGRVLSSLEIAESRRDRRVGLLGRDGIDGAMLLRPARSVHTMKMRFAIDIAHLDRDLVVLSTTTMSLSSCKTTSGSVGGSYGVISVMAPDIGLWRAHGNPTSTLSYAWGWAGCL